MRTQSREIERWEIDSLSITERQIWLPNSEVETASPKGCEGTASLYFRVG